MGMVEALMKLAVVGWAADSGVGRELIDAVRHLPVACAFVLSNPAKPTRTDLISGVPHHMAGPDPISEMTRFIDYHHPDTVLTWEVPGRWDFPAIWRKKGLRWVHMVHWDWFSPDHMDAWRYAKLLSPNRMCHDELLKHYSLKSEFLPVPVDTDRMIFQERRKCELFVSGYGYGGLHDRRSLPEIFSAWRGMPQPPPPLAILAQQRPPELDREAPPYGIAIEVGNMPEPRDLWSFGDVAVQPSRYEGVGVSMVEAQASGVPVIAVDAPPMNEVAPDLLVPVAYTGSVNLIGKPLPSYVPSVDALRQRVLELHMKDISALSRRARERAEKTFSWKALRGRWVEALEGKA
jgi:glycosyltransferase involved in cell wall biosynthesis